MLGVANVGNGVRGESKGGGVGVYGTSATGTVKRLPPPANMYLHYKLLQSVLKSQKVEVVEMVEVPLLPSRKGKEHPVLIPFLLTMLHLILNGHIPLLNQTILILRL